MRALFDACVSPHLARAIRELERGGPQGWEIVYHTEIFAAGAADIEWIPHLRTHRIDVLVTADDRIRWSPDEKAAWKAANTLTYFMSNTYCNKRNWEQVSEMIRWWPRVKRHAQDAAAGSAWSLPWEGKAPTLLGVR